jgi:hypothetical protein
MSHPCSANVPMRGRRRQQSFIEWRKEASLLAMLHRGALLDRLMTREHMLGSSDVSRFPCRTPLFQMPRRTCGGILVALICYAATGGEAGVRIE